MYNYKLLNNHYVVEIDGNHYIIDTGFPCSVTFRSDLHKVEIEGKKKPIELQNPAIFRFSIPKTHWLVGYPVDGLLGFDALSEGVTFYKDNEMGGRVDFTAHNIDGEVHQIVKFHQNYCPMINVNGDKLFMVDTGARYGYGDISMFVGSNPFSIVDDYNPSLGSMRSPIFHTSINLKGKGYNIDVCYHERAISLAGEPNLLMVYNITDFFEKECCIDYTGRKIIFN